MFWSKKKISGKDYVEMLLIAREEGARRLSGVFTKEFNYSGDSKLLEHEVIVFSLWLLILALPPSKYKFRDQIHDEFSKSLSNPEKKALYEEIDKRYRNYFEAYEVWQENPKQGGLLGAVIVEIIINQNSDFSLKEYLPKVGAMEAMKAFSIFAEYWEKNIQMIGYLEKKFAITD